MFSIHSLIDKIRAVDETHRHDFMAFLEHLQRNLNDAITEQDAVEMLALHIMTKPIFDALFDSENCSNNNPISQALDKVVGLLENVVPSDDARLQGFYDSVKTRVQGIKTAEERQQIIIELYDQFFKRAFPQLSNKLGIVYTPVEVVDFMLKSVDQVLRQEFGVGLDAKDIHVLDPFTGTGIFIVRLLQSGLIAPENLRWKYENELHANEIMLLAYYIAAINIEHTYCECTKRRASFSGIVHTDTFTMTQNESPITVIIGNPPYSAGATEFGDGTKRTVYKCLEERVRQTYAETSVATNKNSLYDSYIRAFRWASDRIGEKGIICFVTNGGWLDGNAMDGFRKCLAEEFSDIYVCNLRGGIRGKSRDAAKKEGQNIFPIMTQVAITLAIKNPKKTDTPCTINYYEFDDYLKKSEKLQFLTDAGGVQGMNWQRIIPNAKHDWINQRSEKFDRFIGIDEVFGVKTLGVQTNRDAWCYNFSKYHLAENISRMIAFYHEQVKAYTERKQTDKELKADDFIIYDPSRISWSRSLKNCLTRQVKIQFSPRNIISALYRPFCKTNFYFHRPLNHEVSQMPRVFPESGLANVAIAIETGKMGQIFSCLMIDTVPDCCVFGYTQCFPYWVYDPSLGADAPSELFPRTRRENISDASLSVFLQHYGDDTITKEDIFYYVYGILHSESYKTRFSPDLKKQLPRIPMVDDFRTFSQAGHRLAQLHLNYETLEPYPLIEKTADGRRQTAANYKVIKMRYASKIDKSRIIYNDTLTLEGIPPETYRYIVNGKSALDWIVERYAVTTHRDSGIVNNPNDWCNEIGNERYIVDLIKRIVTLSVESIKIIDGLPELRF